MDRPNVPMSPEALRAAMNRLPRVPLADLPTPLHDCPRLSEVLGGPRILIKRDDLTGLAFGGNKTRKFDFSFGEIRRQGADSVITGAASQSNHSRQTAAAAAKMGIQAYLVLRRDAKSTQGIQGNLLLDYLLGADVRLVEGDQNKAKQELFEELKAKGRTPYLMGHYDAVLGAVAYVGCAVEIQEQMKEMGVSADHLCLASGSGTQAGLALGAKALGMGCTVTGFRPSKGGENRAVCANIAQLANEAAERIGLGVRVSPDEIENTDEYTGEAYGIITEACCDAVRTVAQTEGIFLDPVYVGKAMSGVFDRCRRGTFPKDRTVVFVHTGGTPALFAYRDELVTSGGYEVTVVRA